MTRKQLNYARRQMKVAAQIKVLGWVVSPTGVLTRLLLEDGRELVGEEARHWWLWLELVHRSTVAR